MDIWTILLQFFHHSNIHLRVATYEISAKDHGIGGRIVSSCQDGHRFLVEFESIWYCMSSGRIWIQQLLQDLGGPLGLALLPILKVLVDALSTYLQNQQRNLSA